MDSQQQISGANNTAPNPVNPAPSDPEPIPEEQSEGPVVEQSPTKKREGGLLSFFGTLVIAFVLVQIINLFLFQSYKVFGSSMYPTLHDNDRLIISKVSRTWARVHGKDYQPARGDIIVFINPRQPDIQLIKRVVGLPGDRVVLDNGKITVYNSEHPKGFNPDDAPYGKRLPEISGKTDVTVPADQLFVSGDNRAGSNSLDSRNELGTVPEKNIVGTLKLRLWPPSSAQLFHTGE